MSEAPQQRPALHVVKPVDPARLEGGQLRQPYGAEVAWATLPEGPYWIAVLGWKMAAQRFGWRKPRHHETEREWDWRVFLHGPVLAVGEAHPDAPAARSSVFRYKQAHQQDPWVSVALRFSVTEKSELRVVPPGGHLWELLAITGQRGAALTADALDAIIGWTLLAETTVTREHRPRKGQRRGAAIAATLQHSLGHAVSDAKPPMRPTS